MDYARKNVRIPVEDNTMGGGWDEDTFSHSTEVLEALENPDILNVTLISATQQGKSRIGLTWISHTVDEDPSPM